MYELVYSSHRAVAQAAGEFLNERLFVPEDASVIVRTKRGKKRLPNTPLIRDLVQFFIESEVLTLDFTLLLNNTNFFLGNNILTFSLRAYKQPVYSELSRGCIRQWSEGPVTEVLINLPPLLIFEQKITFTFEQKIIVSKTIVLGQIENFTPQPTMGGWLLS